MKLVFSHPTGNANVRAAAKGFAQAGLLSEFHTSIASFPGSLLDRFATIGPLAEIRRRQFDPVLKPITKTWPWREMGRLAAGKIGINSFSKHETGAFCVDAVYQSLDKRVAKRLDRLSKARVNAVYAYEDGAQFSFREAKRLNLKCNYDLPIGYWRASMRLLENERILKPEWEPTLVSFQDSALKHAFKDEELRLADKIFVASQFTAETLKDFPGALAPIEVIPYGFPPVATKRDYHNFSMRRRLKLLFVGGLSQRKGIAELFSAVDALKDYVELTIIGNKINDNCPALNFALTKHKWIQSLPHAEILNAMKAHDVLVFPSLFEGFGLVITEAMSQGTPVITTDRTAGPDFIESEHNGWLVEAGSANALQAAIEKLIYQPKAVIDAGKAAMATAQARPWEVYGRELAEAILKHQ
ncbi:glycosyltransferase [uncultured Pontibacter sp.]|uniref:glycosyltransferase n=1 Tax=uncultured Pontibacter sp. TaxID=453356 RepID=UPI00262B60A2|nr:glycosyltransferase [uncultured Pontibacter sp.]